MRRPAVADSCWRVGDAHRPLAAAGTGTSCAHTTRSSTPKQAATLDGLYRGRLRRDRRRYQERGSTPSVLPTATESLTDEYLAASSGCVDSAPDSRTLRRLRGIDAYPRPVSATSHHRGRSRQGIAQGRHSRTRLDGCMMTRTARALPDASRSSCTLRRPLRWAPRSHRDAVAIYPRRRRVLRRPGVAVRAVAHRWIDSRRAVPRRLAAARTARRATSARRR